MVTAAVVHKLADSPYDDAQLDFIYHAEVFSVLSTNLLVAAGVWDAFDMTWLEAEIIKRSPSRKPNKPVMWWRALVYGETLEEWREIRQKLLAVRAQMCENNA